MSLSQVSISDASCAACKSKSLRKAAIVCSGCGERWHTSCAKITVAQSKSLIVWHCAPCMQKESGTFQASSPGAVDLGDDDNVQTEAGTATQLEGIIRDIPTGLAQLRKSTPIVRLIPKPARA